MCTLTDSDQPLILNVSDSEECIRECAIIYARESTVYYLNQTCFCMTIAQLNAMIQDEQSAPDFDSDVQALPSPLIDGSVDCLLPGDECTSSDHAQCCDSAQCLYQDYAADGTKVGICCVKNSAFGCGSDSDCCSGTRSCYHGFCLKSEEIPADTADSDGNGGGSSQPVQPQPVAPAVGAMAIEGLTVRAVGGERGGITLSVTAQIVVAAVFCVVMAYCISFVVWNRMRSKRQRMDCVEITEITEITETAESEESAEKMDSTQSIRSDLNEHCADEEL